MRPYLEDAILKLRMEHSSLWWILKRAGATDKLTFWKLLLMESDFEVVYKAVVKHQAADALSRLLTNGSYRTLLENDILIMAVTSPKCNPWNPQALT